jgi:nicotinate-nucleotide adenylyltransferase
MAQPYELYVKLARDAQNDKRYTHTMNVASMCRQLAEKHAPELTDKAYLAGLLHDIRKQAALTVQKAEVDKYTELCKNGGLFFPPDSAEIVTEGLWHAISGAHYAQHVLQIDDHDIINAIRFHTIGRAGMSKLEQIVYLGDLVSMERDFPDVEYYRKIAFKDLDKAMFESLKFSFLKNVKKNGLLPLYATEGYNYYLKQGA